MPSLKEYRNRIVSVKSTRKITSAMKMVAASKLKKAQEQAEASQPYARSMAAMMARVAANLPAGSGPRLLAGTGKDDTHLLILVTSDRGLCGGFNANLLRRARAEIRRLQGLGKTVKLICVGRKARDALRRTYASALLESFIGLGGRKRISFADADQVTQLVLDQFAAGEFDVCTLIYNEFKSILVQAPSTLQLIPFSIPSASVNDNKKAVVVESEKLHYEFEPDEESIMEQLLPRNLGVQIFRALLDSAAGEQAARMTAMDNATRNAGDLINRLTLQYNRARQAHITKELIEIISGAEAV
ncbi:MAG: F0F1 ATP synthase subunit gamma [Alphaproteobacteria bacterium]|nr:F0F1 ATP synthase subunit gamma [Alphaproteobacteria bacterium]MBU0858501.1 F0F1 ATP synthase subunit gamma [Alphaproteobacteria bacterium]